MRQVAVLGATGSIGGSALDVIARHPDRLRASVLAAGRQVDALLDLCRRHRPRHAVIADPAGFAALRDGLREAGLDPLPGPTAIVPIIVGETARAGRMSGELREEHGVLVTGFGYPVVPEGTARLRIQANAAMTDANVAALVKAIVAVAR